MSTTRARPWREAAPWVAFSLLVWGVGLGLQRARPQQAVVELPAWQASFRDVADAEQRTFRHLREALPEVERLRVESGAWPEPSQLAAEGIDPFREDERAVPRTWVLRRHGIYASYVGAPASGSTALRWLVLFIEPTTKEPAPPEDEEHQTMADGVPVHVTVWSQPNDAEPIPDEVLAFPAAQGWVQRLGR